MGSWYTEEYLPSEHWERKKEEVRRVIVEAYGRLTCERCKATRGPFDVHHTPRAYDYLYREPVALLRHWCRACHRYHHGRGPDPLDAGVTPTSDELREMMRRM